TTKLVGLRRRGDLAEMAVAAGSREPDPLAPVHCTPQALPSASASNCPSVHHHERGSPMKNRKREICTSGSVRDEDGQPPHLLGRRKVLLLAAGAAALPAVARVASAQAYPTRPVRIVVGFAAGYDKLDFVFLRDIAPVASLIREPQIMLANPSVMTKTVPELIAYAKVNPGKITMASAGVGSAGHLVGELFKMMAGVDFVHVPYRGPGPALADLRGGQVMISFAGIAGSIEYIRPGKLRALAVTTATRSQALPDVPTVSEFVPGFEAGDWFGVGAPKHTPAAIVDKLNGEIATALADPKIKARFADLGGTGLALTPAECGKLVA